MVKIFEQNRYDNGIITQLVSALLFELDPSNLNTNLRW